VKGEERWGKMTLGGPPFVSGEKRKQRSENRERKIHTITRICNKCGVLEGKPHNAEQ
jgi:hypothetical protein